MSRCIPKRCARCGQQDRSPGIAHQCPRQVRLLLSADGQSVLVACCRCKGETPLPVDRIRCVAERRFVKGLCCDPLCRRPINVELIE